MKSPIVIGLLWHSSNSPNLGVGALTVSNVAIIEKLASDIGVDVSFKIFQWDDPEPDYVVGENIEIIRLRGRHLLFHHWFISQLRKCALVLDISTGDGFADIYGVRRFGFNALSKTCALISGRPLVLAPQTVGPFKRLWARYLAAMFMRAARCVVTRDDLSAEYVRSLGIASNLVESTDVAFRLPYRVPAKNNAHSVRVGINVSGLLYNGGYTRENMFGLKADYSLMVRNLVRGFLGLGTCEVHLVPHVIPRDMPVEDDHLVSMKLREEFPNVIVAPRFASPSAAKSYIAGMDYFCGSRMHACIAAFSSGVPVMPIAYSRKFAGLFGTLGYEHLADCKTMGADQIVEIALDGFHQRHQLAEEVAEGMKQAELMLARYEDVLKPLLQDVA
jgi:colanic acid/amylovoran biosynthesis protein